MCVCGGYVSGHLYCVLVCSLVFGSEPLPPPPRKTLVGTWRRGMCTWTGLVAIVFVFLVEHVTSRIFVFSISTYCTVGAGVACKEPTQHASCLFLSVYSQEGHYLGVAISLCVLVVVEFQIRFRSSFSPCACIVVECQSNHRSRCCRPQCVFVVVVRRVFQVYSSSICAQHFVTHKQLEDVEGRDQR